MSGAGLGTVLGGARPCVDAGLLLGHVLERVHAEFVQLLESSRVQSDDDARKRALLAHLHASRQQLLRLAMLVQWHPKAKALLECVEQGKVLDVARQHGQMLESAAQELFEAHARRQPESCPMLDVTTALEVMSTGMYSDLPSSIERERPAPPLPPRTQQARLRRVSHLIYSHLLKVNLPAGVTVASVGPGYAVLRAAGLYEVKVTLVPAADLPEETSANVKTEDATAAGTSAAAGASAAAGGEAEEDSGEVTSGPKPVRWRWHLLAFLLPANAVRGPPLKEAQVEQLLGDLRNRMHLAADYAVYARRRATAAQTVDGPRGDAIGGPAASTSMAGGAAGPSKGGPGTSTHTNLTGASQEKRAAANQALLAAHEADEVAAPLMIMHCVLSDVGGRLLLDACMSVAHQLVGRGGRWEGHAQVDQPRRLRPGLRITYWTKSVPLLPAAVQVVATAGGQAGPGQAPQDGASHPLLVSEPPCLEIGLSPEGGVQVACTPILPSSAEHPLQLDAATANVDELLLRASAELAQHELSLLKDRCDAVMQVSLPLACHTRLRHSTLYWTPLSAAASSELKSASTAAENLPGRGSTTASSSGMSSSSTGGAFEVTVRNPVLEVWVEGMLLMRVCRNLLTGRVLVQPGPGLGSDAVLDKLTWWTRKEEDLNSALVRVHAAPVAEGAPGAGAAGAAGAGAAAAGTTPQISIGTDGAGNTGNGPGAQMAQPHVSVRTRVMNELIKKVVELVRDQQFNLVMLRCLGGMRHLRLQLGNLRHLQSALPAWQEFKRYFSAWMFQPMPFPAHFPPLHAMPPHTPVMQLPRGLLFGLGADHLGYAANPSFSLLVLSATTQLVPVQVLKVITVPASVYAHLLPPSPKRTLTSREQSVISLTEVAAAQRTAQQEADGQLAAAGPSKAAGNQGEELTPETAAAMARAQGAAAQRAMFRSLAAVVHWCHKRIVSEHLTSQLKALGAEFVEVFVGGTQVIKVTKVAGVSIPCRIARRPELSPRSVGMTSLTLTLSHSPAPSSSAQQQRQPDAAAANGPAPAEEVAAVPKGTRGGRLDAAERGEFVATVRGRFFQSDPSVLSASSSSSNGGTAAGGRGLALSASQLECPAPGVLALRYCLSAGHSVLDMLADVAAVLRLQTFLARLEAMARGGQALRVTAAARESLLPDEGEMDGPGGLASRGPSSLSAGEGNTQDGVHRPVKKARVEVGGGEGQVLSNGRSHGTGTGGGEEDGSDGYGRIRWQWDRNGSVQLSQYSPTSAMLQYDAPPAAATAASSQELRLHVSWRRTPPPPPPPKPPPGKRAAADPVKLPQLAELVTCRIEGAAGALGQNPVGGASEAVTPYAAGGSSGAGRARAGMQANQPVVALLKSLGEMADAGEEGLLLDALQISTLPMLEVQAAAAAITAGRVGAAGQGGANGSRQSAAPGEGSKPLVQLAHIADGAPFKHRMLAQLPRPLPADAQGTLGAGGCLAVDVASVAIGRSWIRLSFIPRDPAASQQGAHASADGDLLAAIQAQLLQQLGPAAVHVAHTWSSVATVPRSWQGKGSEAGPKQLWFLVANAQLKQSLQLVMSCASSSGVAVKKQEY